MNILFIVNNISKTSIPWRWAKFFNASSSMSIKTLKITSIKGEISNTRKNINIIHGHHIKSMFLILVINKFLNKKTVYTVHGSYLFLSKLNSLLLRYIFKRTDKIIFVNKTLLDVLPTNLKSSIKQKSEIILNGVELKYDYIKTDVYKKFGINPSDTIVFHPARFVTEKNHLRIISAFDSALKKNNKLKLILAGSGELENDIKELIKKLQIQDSIILIGLIDRDEVYSFLEICDLFLMPSISEGLNISFLEAISMHCKIIISNIDQFTYPIEAYKLNPEELNVSFVDPLDEKDIAQGILSAINKDLNTTYNASEFSLETMMKQYQKVYLSLI